jgi:phosphoribosylformylglycinamidine cyclo-ligase
LASSGLHSNGYSLARRIVFDVMNLSLDAIFPGTGRSVGDVLLEPTRIYVNAVLPVRQDVHAMAHITGGGLPGNLPRVLPEGCRAILSPAAWAESVSPVFQALREAGHVGADEMYRTFNMGIGYVLVVPAARASAVAASLTAAGETVHLIGEVQAGARGVELAQ